MKSKTTVKRSKFNNSPVYYCTKTKTILSHRPTTGALTKNFVRFASIWEFTVYQALIDTVGNNVQCQVPIEIKPKTQFSGKLTYVCDFLVAKRWYVEAKGYLTPEASCKLKLLELVNPEVRNRILIVSDKPVHLFGRQFPPSIDLGELKTIIGENQAND